MLKRKTKRGRLVGQLKRIRHELNTPRVLHDPIGKIGAWLHKVVLGHLNYYAVQHKLDALGMFVLEVKRAWLKAIRRLSQRNRMTWVRFNQLLKRWIPTPRIIHTASPFDGTT